MGSNTELESYLHSTMTAIDCNSMDGDSDSDGDFYLPSPQDLACQAGGPPATYIAQKWAEILVPQGEALFGRQDIANCVLIVGQSRYFVHWQVLWCRSPTFRRIFDDMAANGVWSSPTSPSAGRHDNDNLDDDREAMLARLSKELAGNTRQSHDENNGDHIINNNNISHHDNQNLAHQNLFSGLLERHTISDQETPSLSSSSDEDDFLPELSVALSDPEGCRFEELLYWLYTNESERWRASFSPQNYNSILENILQLNIASPHVLEICETFERTTHPTLGLCGLAQKTFQSNELAHFASTFRHGQPET